MPVYAPLWTPGVMTAVSSLYSEFVRTVARWCAGVRLSLLGTPTAAVAAAVLVCRAAATGAAPAAACADPVPEVIITEVPPFAAALRCPKEPLLPVDAPMDACPDRATG